MQTLIVLRGLPGSGKSTWSRNLIERDSSYFRVCLDELRIMMNGESRGKGRRRTLNRVRDSVIRAALQDGWNVVYDFHNLDDKSVVHFRRIAREFGAQLTIEDFRQVPLEVCIARDNSRERSLGEARIRELHAKFF